MATIGHIAAGIALARGLGTGPPPLTTALIVAAAVVPDVDFLLDLNHRGPTHSIGFAAAVGIGAYALLRLTSTPRPALGAMLAGAAVVTHIGLDLLTAHSPVAVFWPITRAEFVLENPFLPAAPTDEDLFSLRGALSAFLELAWSAGLVAVAWLPDWNRR